MTQPNEDLNRPAVDIEANVKALAELTGEDPGAIRAVLAAMDQQAGEPTGTIRFDDATKALAHRVIDGGIAKWLVSHPTEGIHYEMTPTKTDWRQLS